jgi:hypothetical protein
MMKIRLRHPTPTAMTILQIPMCYFMCPCEPGRNPRGSPTIG